MGRKMSVPITSNLEKTPTFLLGCGALAYDALFMTESDKEELGDGAEKESGSETPELRKLTKEQGWRLHILRDHVPFRRDCEQCVMMLGTGRPHRRVKQKSCYVFER